MKEWIQLNTCCPFAILQEGGTGMEGISNTDTCLKGGMKEFLEMVEKFQLAE